MIKVLFASTEAIPFMKTGGLGDVSGTLPIALQKFDINSRLIIPAYAETLRQISSPKIIAKLFLPGVAGKINLLETLIPDTSIKVILVDYAPAFSREGNPYMNNMGQAWDDNAERFALFCRVICEVCMNRVKIKWQPEVVHCNDWQAGLVPALLQFEKNPPASIFTIHNLAYQGVFNRQTFNALSLPSELWHHSALEFHGQMSFIKGGIVFADRINTVSPHYAKEIQTAEFGCGLEGLLQQRSDELVGIMNGIDYDVWNPESDPLIHRRYSATTLSAKTLCAKTLSGKYENKRHLLREFALSERDDTLLIGTVCRLAEQKGIDIILEFLKNIAHFPMQFCLLGIGDIDYQQRLEAIAAKNPEQIAIKICHDERIAHQIEAGADVFLMPSHFEPCGLNQLYSLRYGTVPIVHFVGGLADSVVDTTEKTLADNSATGFVFREPTVAALNETVLRALHYFQQVDLWQKIMFNGMQQRFDWQTSAAAYLKLYQSAIFKKVESLAMV